MSGGYAGKLQRYIAEIAPGFLQGPRAGAFLEALGVTLDDGLETLLAGLRQAYPFSAWEEYLTVIGADRGIRRYPGEPADSYRTRLAQWRQIKRHAGSHYGEMINIQPIFLPGALPRLRIVHQDGNAASATWHTLNPDGTYEYFRAIPSNWNWDDIPAWWSRFWLIIDVSGLPTNGALWDDGTTWDDGATVWDGYLNSTIRDNLIAMINDTKAAHSVLWGIILATDPASFDPASVAVTDPDGFTTLPAGNWASAIDPVTGLPSRLPTALFAFDVGQGT